MRSLRESIVLHLRHTSVLTNRDKDLIEFAQLIQTVYPNPCYTVEHARRWTTLSSHIRRRRRRRRNRRRRRVPMLEFVESDDDEEEEEEEKERYERQQHITNDFLAAFSGCDVGDIGPAMSHSGFHFHNKRLRRRRSVIETNTRLKEIRCVLAKTKTMISNEKVKHLENVTEAQRLGEYHPEGYSHIVLYWIRTASEESRRRIMLEKFNSLSDSERVLTPLFNIEKNSSLDIESLKYHLTHCDWRGVRNWVENATDSTTSHVKSVCSNNLVTSLCSDILVTCLSKRGIFLLSHNDNAAALLHRLCVSEQLFSPKTSFNSEFHNFFVNFCIEHEFFSVLRDYTWIHRLDLNMLKRRNYPLIMTIEEPWAKMLLAGRTLELFEASISNAIFCGYPESVSEMMSSGHVVLALGTLMYGGKLDEDNISMLKRWPSLLRALYNPHDRVTTTITKDKDNNPSFQTYKQDMDLFALLYDKSPFKLSTVQKQMENADLPFNFRNSYKEHAFEERLGVSYYLSTSRPLRALQHCLSGLERPEITMEIRERKVHVSSDIFHLRRLVRRVALESMERQDVLAACIVFLKACDLSSEVLSVDVEAAKRILFAAAASSQKHDIVELFMVMKEGPDQIAVLEALRLLGEATAELVKHKTPTKESFEYPESPWKLVTLFCRTHGLPRSMALLQELARSNEYVQFLHEAQREQCDSETVLRIVRGTFTDRCLKDHLQIAIEGINNKSGVTSLSGVPKRNDDVFELLFQSESVAKDKRGETLLRWALQKRKPVLAVIAICLASHQCSYLDCWIVWLISSCDNLSVVPIPYPAVWTLDHLGTIISDLLRKHRFVELLRSFQIFNPENPLFEFVLFYRAFVLRLNVFREHLQNFVRDIREISSSSSSNVEWSAWTTRLAQAEVKHLLHTIEIQNRFLECDLLLEALSESRFASTYRRLCRSYSVLSRTGLSLTNFRSPQIILNALLKDSHHEVARQYTLEMLREKEVELSQDDLHRITLEEVRSYVERWIIVALSLYLSIYLSLSHTYTHSSRTHNNNNNRYVTKFRDTPLVKMGAVTSKERQSLWKRCYECFRLHNHPKIRSASFFLSTAQEQEEKGDRVQLLTMARKLLGKDHSYVRPLKIYTLLISLDCGTSLSPLPTPISSNKTPVIPRLSVSARGDVARAIEKLLKRFDVERAKQISDFFGERSAALAGVEAASALAESSNSEIVKLDSEISDLLPLPVQRLIQAATQVRHSLLVEAVDRKSALFDALVNTAPQASRLCIVDIAVQWRAAKLLRRSYDSLVNQDPTAILRTFFFYCFVLDSVFLLLLRHPSNHKMTKSRYRYAASSFHATSQIKLQG